MMAWCWSGPDMISIGGVCGSSRRFWRPFIGTVAAFAVAAQTLLIAFGLTLPARADVGVSIFELCPHGRRAAPAAPRCAAAALPLRAAAEGGIAIFDPCRHDAQDAPSAPAGDPAAAACAH